MDRTTCGACGAWIGDDELQDLREEVERLRELEGTVRILSAAQTKLVAERETLRADSATLQRARELAAEQATDTSLWRVYFRAPEERALQAVLRELARVIEEGN